MATILEAVKMLAARCNYASSLDGNGFNKLDAEFGHSIASRTVLSFKQEVAALRMLQKYTKQLATMGIDYTSLKVLAIDPSAPIVPVQIVPAISVIQKKAWIEDAYILLSFPYDPTFNDVIKQICSVYPSFDRVRKLWAVSMQDFDTIFPLLSKCNFDMPSLVEHKRELDRLANAIYVKKLNHLGDLNAPLAPNFILLDYQKEGIKTILRKGNLILADDMGLGKTMQALIAARAYQKLGYTIYVVAPVTLHDNWRKEAAIAKVNIEIFSWAKVPKPLEKKHYVVIADEAHYMQNGDKKRVKWEIDGKKYELRELK